MAVTTTRMQAAVEGMQRVLAPGDRRQSAANAWRWEARQALARLRDALVAEAGGAGEDGWTAAREGAAMRERTVLLTRVRDLSVQVLERPDLGSLHADLRRLLEDTRRHVQRLHDIAYDEVELELGGSE